jgi:1-acyl-sn-glycerol-3-phosphate acyltransferase
MEKFLIYLRSLVYMVYLVASTIYISVLIISLCRFVSYPRICELGRAWGRWNLSALQIICGLKYCILGQDNLPNETAIVLCKHQSAWETIALRALMQKEQTWVLKDDLLKIPVFGWALRCFGPISIDRSAGTKAIRTLLSDGRKWLNLGRWVIVFPEGTRVPVGERKEYSIGGALLAEKTGFPVVPIAHNAGLFWSRRSLMKKPGRIDLVIGPVIDTRGKKAAEINREAEEWIEATVAELTGEPAIR